MPTTRNLKPFSSPDGSSPSLTIRVDLNLADDAWLEAHYVLEGELERVVIPARESRGEFRRGLWETTCLELFVAAPDAPAYVEWNFSPSGHWARFDFTDYRQGRDAHEPEHPRLVWTRPRPDRVELTGRFATAPIVAALGGAPAGSWLFGVTAVIARPQGPTEYWAARHAGQKPDFHLRQSFEPLDL